MERRIGDRRVMWGFIARLIMEQILELSRAQAGGDAGRGSFILAANWLEISLVVLINKTRAGQSQREEGYTPEYVRRIVRHPVVEYFRCKQTGVQAVLVSVLEALPGISCNMQIVNLDLDISEQPEH